MFDLRCSQAHVFEAWFASTATFEDQRGAGLVHCPLCDDAVIEKAVMAPNIATKGNRVTSPPPAEMKAALAALAQAQAKMLEGSKWVGKSFADRARAMHDGTMDRVSIHGQATRAEARALADDGIAIAPLPLPVVPPDQTN